MKLTKLFSLTIISFLAAQVCVESVQATSPTELNTTAESNSLIAQAQRRPRPRPRPRPGNANASSSQNNSNTGTLRSLAERNNCKMARKGEKMYCVRYRFETINGSGGNPATALISESAEVRRSRQGNRYQINPNWRASAPRPMIVWTAAGSAEFADQFTPQSRAASVTGRFNQFFIQRGQVRIPNLVRGTVNRLPVICAASSSQACDSSNILWTLKRENSNNSNIISQLQQAMRGNAGAPIFESQDDFGASDTVNMSSLIDSVIGEEYSIIADLDRFESEDDYDNNDDWGEFESEDDYDNNDDWGEFESEDDYDNNDDWGEFESDDDWGEF